VEKILTHPHAAIIQNGTVIAQAGAETDSSKLIIMDSNPFFYLASGGKKDNTVIINDSR